jgi:hypothetical protein
MCSGNVRGEMSRKGPEDRRLEMTPGMKRHIKWKKLTHSGRRTAQAPVCDECGAEMSAEDIAEYRAEFGPGRTA